MCKVRPITESQLRRCASNALDVEVLAWIVNSSAQMIFDPNPISGIQVIFGAYRRNEVGYRMGNMTVIHFAPVVNSLRDFVSVRASKWGAVFLLGGFVSSPLAVASPGDAANFSAISVTVSEAAGAVTLTVNRQGIGGGTASVDYATADFTANAPGDYTSTSGTLSWGDGDLTPRTITVPIIDDTVHEGNESFFVRLSNPQGLGLGVAPSEYVVITDNDAAVAAAPVAAPTLGGIAGVLFAALLALMARAG